MSCRVSRKVLLWCVLLSWWCLLSAELTQLLPAAEDTAVSQPQTKTTPGVFALATRFRTAYNPNDRHVSGLLTREMMRQALLITARDELGLSTRDETLRESFVDADGNTIEPLDILTKAQLDGIAHIELHQKNGDGKRPIWSHDYNFGSNSYETYLTLATVMEAASRTTFVDALHEAGYNGKRHRSAEPAEIPDEIETDLHEMNFVPQFAAVRWAHEDIRRRGESTSSLGVLVRGYSHLSLLTEFYWNSVHLACKARALLYAERMVATHPDSIEALWYRAYARSMVGLHKAALEQLKVIAEKTGLKEPDFETLPTCMRIIDARCRYDIEQFRAIASEYDSLRPLAHFLIFRTCEMRKDPALLCEAEKETREHCPDAYGIFYALYYQGDTETQRSATEASSSVFGEHFLKRMRDVSSLPNSVEQLLDTNDENGQPKEPPCSYEIANALIRAGAVGRDVGEPSWAALGRMAQEVTFVQAGTMLHEESREFRPQLAKEIIPFVEGHPYAPIIECFGVDPPDTRRYAEILRNLQILDPQHHMRPLFLTVYWARTPTCRSGIGNTASRACQRDFTPYSMFHMLMRTKPTSYSEKYRRMFVRELGKVSPYSPDRVRISIVLTPSPSANQLAKWEEQAQDSKELLYEIGKAYARCKRHDGTVRCLEKVIDDYPFRANYVTLANAYVGLGKGELWLPTMKRYLETTHRTANHAAMRMDIAKGLIARGRWKEAIPYAESAAESGVSGAMICAADCNEGAGNLKESERWMERYAESSTLHSPTIAWYFWCRRNGKQDIESVRRRCEPHIKEVANPPANTRYPREVVPTLACFYLLENRQEEALKTFAKSFGFDKNLLAAGNTLLLAAELNEPDVRDKCLAAIAETYQTENQENRSLKTRYARILKTSLGSTPPKKPDPEAVKNILDKADPVLATEICYVIGRTFELCGDRPTAEEYYRKTLKQGKFQSLNCTLAGFRLHQEPEAEKKHSGN